MKKTTNNIKKRRNYILLAIMTFMVSLMLVGCSSETATETVKSETETLVKEEAPETVAKEEVIQQEETETVEVQEEVKGIAETVQIKQYETADAWVESLQLEEPTIVIWNSETMENTVLEENQEYQLKENDKILLTLGGRINSFNCNPMSAFNSFEPFKQLYLDMNLNIIGTQDITFEFDVDGEMYTKTATFIAASSDVKTDMVEWETWATNTDTEDVRLAVWNETTGTQILLEDGINGVKYDIQNGDRFSIAHRDIIGAVSINGQEVLPVETSLGVYYEIIPEGEFSHVNVLIKEDGQTEFFYHISCIINSKRQNILSNLNFLLIQP